MIHILIVDDSVVVRRIMTEILSAEDDITVVGSAANGKIALAKLANEKVDLILLDIEMPELDGLELLRIIRQKNPSIPIIMFSALTQQGAAATLHALELGATDYFAKPTGHGGITEAKSIIRSELVPTIRTLATAYAQSSGVQHRLTEHSQSSRKIDDLSCSHRVDLVVIAASTGGPNALATLYGMLKAPLPVPILIVQHMPPMFTRLLAERLASFGKGPVAEARNGDQVLSGTTLVAPGDFHMEVRSPLGRPMVLLNQDTPENSCRPSADPLFRSAASIYGERLLSVVLTGMGQDGVAGCKEVKHLGGSVIVQDQPTSIVWGMPGAVAKAGLADEVLPLPKIAEAIERRVQIGRPR